MKAYHIPVLLKESIEGLNIQPDGIYVDATFGGGGYSKEILGNLSGGHLYAFDMDEDATINIPSDKRLTFIQGNFRFIKNYLRYHNVKSVDGIVADLGVSSHHFDSDERGFTYRSPSSLDMRMNKKGKLTAEIIINDYDPARLAKIFRDYGELPRAKIIADKITEERIKSRIDSSDRLISCIQNLIPRKTPNQFLSRLFQALRIEVNRELENLSALLSDADNLLKVNGRLVIISYHSLEDRMVKNHMKFGNVSGEVQKDIYGTWHTTYEMITKKPITPSMEEYEFNPRSGSARLRIAIKK